MPDRRTVLLGLAALPISAGASPAPEEDGLWVGAPGAEVRVPLRDARWRPLDNGNARWQLELGVARPAEGYPPATLRFRGSAWTNDGQGGDDTRWAVTFTFDRVTALALQGLVGGALRDRVPLGGGLVATFAHTGGTTVSMTLVNRGAVGVGVIVGGRNRGPRDNQWAFEVRRDGRELAALPGHDFGGISQIRFLAPGASLSREADVSAWADCAPPGRYQVRCRWEATLVSRVSFPTDPSDAWDAAFDGLVAWG